MPVVTHGFGGKGDRSARRAAEPAPKMQHRFHPEVARHVRICEGATRKRRFWCDHLFQLNWRVGGFFHPEGQRLPISALGLTT